MVQHVYVYLVYIFIEKHIKTLETKIAGSFFPEKVSLGVEDAVPGHVLMPARVCPAAPLLEAPGGQHHGEGVHPSHGPPHMPTRPARGEGAV